MGRWVKGQISPNPHGRPRRQNSIADIIRQRLDKRAFVDELIRLSQGGREVPHLVQLSAMRLILCYCDGLPLRIEDRKSEVRVVVEYVNEGGYPDSIDVSPMRLIDGGE